MRRLLGVASALLVLVLAAPAVRAQSQGGLTQVSELPPQGRLHEYVLHTTALAKDTHVRVLLPANYDPSQRYPVLYLLHGGVDDYRSWVDKGQAAELTEPYPLIVVMPDAGQGGWYSDWYNVGTGGPPEWETYHIGQLIDWVDATFPTIADRRGRALAGLSMGGFGAMSYASRHPDLFIAAASFSGAVDTVHSSPVTTDAVVDATALPDGGLPESVWGPRATDEIRWEGHNPTDLAENLRGLQLTIRTGNGMTSTGIDPIEYGVHGMSVAFHNRLTALGIPHVMDDYGPGGHQWPLWARDLQRTLPDLMSAFANPPAPPASVTYKSIDPTYSVYGWHVALDRSVVEFSRLQDASAAGFTIVGSGTASVATAALFEPGAKYVVNVLGQPTVMRADRAGRLTVSGIDLGPSIPVQEDVPPGQSSDPPVPRTRTVQVTITKWRGPQTAAR